MEGESSSIMLVIEENSGIEMDDKINVDVKEKEPKVGMIFNSYEDLFDYYIAYGRRLGFPVKRRSSTKGDDGEIKYVAIACSRSGKSQCTSKNPLKPHPTIKTGCKARVLAILSKGKNGI